MVADFLESTDNIRNPVAAMHMMVRVGNVDGYRALNNAYPGYLETRNSEGDTLLLAAVARRAPEMVRALVEDGADLSAQRRVIDADGYYHEHGHELAYDRDLADAETKRVGVSLMPGSKALRSCAWLHAARPLVSMTATLAPAPLSPSKRAAGIGRPRHSKNENQLPRPPR